MNTAGQPAQHPCLRHPIHLPAIGSWPTSTTLPPLGRSRRREPQHERLGLAGGRTELGLSGVARAAKAATRPEARQPCERALHGSDRLFLDDHLELTGEPDIDPDDYDLDVWAEGLGE